MKKVGQFLIDMDRFLGEGQYGKVFLAQEIVDVSRPLSGVNNGSTGASITKAYPAALLGDNDRNSKYFACKVVERQQLCQVKETLVVSEIQN
jgi:hypothetical protein